jgi:hypothetical protein
MTTTTVDVRRLDESDPACLHCRYPGQEAPQDCYVYLDTETGELGAEYDAKIGSGGPASVYYGRTLRWRIPVLTAHAANALLDRLVPAAQTLVDGWVTEWDGFNTIGRPAPGARGQIAQEARDLIAEDCGDAEDGGGVDWSIEDLVVEIDAAEWFVEGDDAVSLGVTAQTTDAELERIATASCSEAASAGDAGHQVLMGAVEWLTAARDEMRTERD